MYPNGTKLDAADSAFFAALGGNGHGWPLNSKATFCYCAERGVEALYRHSTNPARTSWLMLSASLTWLLFTLAAEAYLCCRPSPDAVDEVETLGLVHKSHLTEKDTSPAAGRQAVAHAPNERA